MDFWNKHKRVILLVIAFVIAGVLLSACGNTPAQSPRATMDSGEIIQIVKHDDVDVKEKVCTGYKTERYKSMGKWKTREVCRGYKIVEREISPEWYEFELKSGDRTGWTGRLNEAIGESYQEGDQYP